VLGSFVYVFLSMKFLSKKWLSMNTGVAYRKIVRCPNKDQIRNLGRYLDKWFF